MSIVILRIFTYYLKVNPTKLLCPIRTQNKNRPGVTSTGAVDSYPKVLPAPKGDTENLNTNQSIGTFCPFMIAEPSRKGKVKMSICIKCGTELPDRAQFCHMCGKKQAATEKKRASTCRPNGTGSVYKRGKTWMCSVVLGYIILDNGKRKAVRPTKGGFKTKKEAMEYLPILRDRKSVV